MSIKILKKNDKNILKLKKAENGVEYFSFEALEKYEELVQGFSTRIGGVSEGPYASMNLSFSREPDNKEGVLENYKRMAKALGVKEDSFVLSYQEHSTNVRVVNKSDMGKALDREIEGSHVEIGVDVARKYRESAAVINCIGAHHGDEEFQSVEAVLVAAADAISAARPGARRETLENYLKRLSKLEEIAESFEGVEKCFAIQAGREIRVVVKPDKIDEAESTLLVRNIVKRIESELEYPGQIKVVVIRETRVVDFAK